MEFSFRERCGCEPASRLEFETSELVSRVFGRENESIQELMASTSMGDDA